jgi:hypothetical protein
MIESKTMSNGCCTNTLCADRETQLRLARLREELLTNFNSLLIDRIRFLENTINQLSLSPLSPPAATTTSTSEHTSAIPIPGVEDKLLPPSILRRSSSTTAYFLQSPMNQSLPGNVEGARSCPSSVDLSSSNDRRRRFFSSSKKFAHSQTRASTESHSNYLSIPMEAQWSTFTNELGSNANACNEKGRLESRRFACDVDDNEVRAFKAMVYMEQARKQHARPLTRLRQALGMSTNSNTSNYLLNNPKKHSNA